MDLTGLPIPTIKGIFSYKRKDINVDSTNIPQNSAKIRAVGFRRKPFLIKCDGNGGFTFEKLQTKEDQLKELKKLLDEELINKREYNKAKKDLGF